MLTYDTIIGDEQYLFDQWLIFCMRNDIPEWPSERRFGESWFSLFFDGNGKRFQG